MHNSRTLLLLRVHPLDAFPCQRGPSNEASHLVDLAIAEMQALGRPKNPKTPLEVFDRLKGIVLRVISPDATPPSPLLKAVQDAQVQWQFVPAALLSAGVYTRRRWLLLSAGCFDSFPPIV